MPRYFLGVDVSTTGAKALLIDEKGKVAASATTALTLQTPKPLWSCLLYTSDAADEL